MEDSGKTWSEQTDDALLGALSDGLRDAAMAEAVLVSAKRAVEAVEARVTQAVLLEVGPDGKPAAGSNDMLRKAAVERALAQDAAVFAARKNQDDGAVRLAEWNASVEVSRFALRLRIAQHTREATSQ